VAIFCGRLHTGCQGVQTYIYSLETDNLSPTRTTARFPRPLGQHDCWSNVGFRVQGYVSQGRGLSGTAREVSFPHAAALVKLRVALLLYSESMPGGTSRDVSLLIPLLLPSPLSVYE
jgi:hypothetical protein